MARRIEVFLLPPDEAHFFSQLRTAIPGVVVVANRATRAGDALPAEEPPFQGIAYTIWNPAVVPEFPGTVRSDGSVWYDSAVGVQWIRGQVRGGHALDLFRGRIRSTSVLTAGRLADELVHVSPDADSNVFVETVFAVLKGCTRGGLWSLRGDRRILHRGHRVGEAAYEAVEQGELDLVDGGLVLHV